MAKKKEECPPGLPLWMLTYSDMVTLLLTFFILLLSMSTTDKIKFEKARNSIENAFGLLKNTQASKFSIPPVPSPPKSQFAPVPQQDTVKFYKQIKTDLELTKINEDVELIKQDNDTLVLRINDAVLFERGKATLNPEAFPLLRKIADIIRPLPMTLRIEGHTDSTPLAGGIMSNWDLSVARAVSVMGFYNRGKFYPLDQMAAVGYGDTRPVAPNISEKNRARNRRVEFILKSKLLTRQDNQADKIPF